MSQPCDIPLTLCRHSLTLITLYESRRYLLRYSNESVNFSLKYMRQVEGDGSVGKVLDGCLSYMVEKKKPWPRQLIEERGFFWTFYFQRIIVHDAGAKVWWAASGTHVLNHRQETERTNWEWGMALKTSNLLLMMEFLNQTHTS